MGIRKRLQQHIDGLFAEVPRSRASYELQEELLANLVARYDDLVAQGKGEEEAYQSVVAGIGNIEELTAGLPNNDPEYTEISSEHRAKSALIKTISVGLYILAGIVLFIGLYLGNAVDENLFTVGMIAALAVCIIPTCLLVYSAARWPQYNKKEETMVEDFKAWNNDAKKTKALRGSISALLWTLTVVVYLAVSFWTWSWQVTWIIFPVAACIETVITLIFRLKEMQE